MESESKIISKLCSFYVSDWHLITMLLPYINKKINEEIKIATVLENEIKNNVKTLVEKLNLKNEDKILDLNWDSTDAKKYSNISNILEKNNKKIIIIVNGSKDYIEYANKNIEEFINKNIGKIKKQNKMIKVINCYEIVEFNGSIVEILDKHDKILNTSGEKEINEIFENYTRKEKII